MRTRKYKPITYTILYLLAVIALLWALTPIVWMILSSFKTQAGMLKMPPKLFFEPNFDTYKFMFSPKGGFFHFLRNSVIAAVTSMTIAVVLGAFGGYALARWKLGGKKHLAFWVISTRMAPIPAVILPLYLMFANVNVLGTFPALFFAYTTFNLPFAIWMMMVFFSDVPEVLEESAIIDGATKFQAFWHIALPVATPGIVATAVLCLMFAWNDFLFASVFTSKATQTIPVAASLLVSQTGIKWGQAMATGTVIITPMLIGGLLVRRYLVRGLSMGAVK